MVGAISFTVLELRAQAAAMLDPGRATRTTMGSVVPPRCAESILVPWKGELRAQAHAAAKVVHIEFATIAVTQRQPLLDGEGFALDVLAS